MGMDLLDLYRRSSEWTLGKVAGAHDLDAVTPCDEWDVRTLLNHMLEIQSYLATRASGRQASPPSPHPPELLGEDPLADFERARADTIEAFDQPGVLEKTGPLLGIAASDQLIHGWDLAKATGQDTTMPAGLAEEVYGLIHGRFTEDQRKGVFKPEVEVRAEASAEDRLLAYTGRAPSV